VSRELLALLGVAVSAVAALAGFGLGYWTGRADHNALPHVRMSAALGWSAKHDEKRPSPAVALMIAGRVLADVEPYVADDPELHRRVTAALAAISRAES
jgi:hypothetical protein